jgi:hypothetical protein
MTAPVISRPTAPQAAALSLFEGHVPCFFSLADPWCTETARWLAWFEHEEPRPEAEGCEVAPWPVCDLHRKAIQAASHPFWRTWHQLPPTLCDGCGTPLRIERFDPL